MKNRRTERRQGRKGRDRNGPSSVAHLYVHQAREDACRRQQEGLRLGWACWFSWRRLAIVTTYSLYTPCSLGSSVYIRARNKRHGLAHRYRQTRKWGGGTEEFISDHLTCSPMAGPSRMVYLGISGCQEYTYHRICPVDRPSDSRTQNNLAMRSNRLSMLMSCKIASVRISKRSEETQTRVTGASSRPSSTRKR